MTSPTYRTCRLRAVRTSGHRCEAVRGGGTVPDARGMVGRGGRRGARLSPRPCERCDPTGRHGGWSENRIPQTRSCWLTAGWTCACPSLLVEPLVKAHASGLAARGLCRPHSSSPGDGQAGYLRYGQEQSGQRRHAQRRCSSPCTFERICTHQSSSHSTATTRCVRTRPNLCRS